MKIRNYFLSVILLLFTISAIADPAPVTMLKQVASQMTGQLDRNQGHITQAVVSNIVHKVLLPHIDLEAMSRSVVGKEYWSQATPAQHEQFKKLFTNLVVKIYSTPLASYNSDTITFKPLRDASGSRVQVESVIERKNGQRIPVSYRLVQHGSNWQVYDFSVEGISMINSYRAQFSSILQQKGMAGLLDRLRAQN